MSWKVHKDRGFLQPSHHRAWSPWQYFCDLCTGHPRSPGEAIGEKQAYLPMVYEGIWCIHAISPINTSLEETPLDWLWSNIPCRVLEHLCSLSAETNDLKLDKRCPFRMPALTDFMVGSHRKLGSCKAPNSRLQYIFYKVMVGVFNHENWSLCVSSGESFRK